jgi:histidyl-tRNA synthetase
MRDFLPKTSDSGSTSSTSSDGPTERYGFEPLETPSMENIETLTGKYGEEGKQAHFQGAAARRARSVPARPISRVRYDLTVPLARVVAEHRAKLPKFYKRYQIQPVWRADRPARGRFREFYQCDVDAIGSTSPVVEVEMLSAVSEVLESLGFSDFDIQLNHREFLTAMLNAAGIRQNAIPTRWSRSTSSTKSDPTR